MPLQPSLNYTAPELIRSKSPSAGCSSDIFSFGCLAYHLIARKPLFDCHNNVKMVSFNLKLTLFWLIDILYKSNFYCLEAGKYLSCISVLSKEVCSYCVAWSGLHDLKKSQALLSQRLSMFSKYFEPELIEIYSKIIRILTSKLMN